MDPLLHLCDACSLWTDGVRASAKQVVVGADLFPPKCMESGDYMRWVLNTTNHITYAHGKSVEDVQSLQLFVYQGLHKHSGETGLWD